MHSTAGQFSNVAPETLLYSAHSSATLLLAAGVHRKVVQARLGHSQIGITLDTYSHVVPTMQLEAAGKLDAPMRSETIRSPSTQQKLWRKGMKASS